MLLGLIHTYFWDWELIEAKILSHWSAKVKTEFQLLKPTHSKTLYLSVLLYLWYRWHWKLVNQSLLTSTVELQGTLSTVFDHWPSLNSSRNWNPQMDAGGLQSLKFRPTELMDSLCGGLFVTYQMWNMLFCKLENQFSISMRIYM